MPSVFWWHDDDTSYPSKGILHNHCGVIRNGTAQNPSEVILYQIDWGRMVTHH